MSTNLSHADLQQAAAMLQRGGLVAFPTETVYGLGADAANGQAVARIFAVKGRPADHPLIVHISDADQMTRWAREIPEAARILAAAFWPGPLTIILPRSSLALDAVTGGLDTIALRVPGHPLALELLQTFGGGVAAPSANRYGRVSPTTAAHVREELGSTVDLILDGGPCRVGLESTIVDLACGMPCVVRPGAVTEQMLSRALHVPVRTVQDVGARCPGQKPSHYAPRARVRLVACGGDAVRESKAVRSQGLRVGVLASQRPDGLPEDVVWLELGGDLDAQARRLYRHLRQADHLGLADLVVVLPAGDGLGQAIVDRLRRAAGPR